MADLNSEEISYLIMSSTFVRNLRKKFSCFKNDIADKTQRNGCKNEVRA